ncbi:transcriptional regulator, CarD family [Dethiosulfatibacter aminovorans DSM 17477]|uniref:Transcriptional regulator, CarD family n=1 Tax=Dethiosulfatibacter aminovorans DSM 17477 TaxID=1121476 RepID=A0A1M6FQZ8_9FIRM|nr:CarD family transcriptional regulator [Dethiosulfatibacter aminovorans]SHJ00127.1 transcriptional regulator, CarD family [Dethiosulfatibacter aminovorans DSM 17477]
MYNLGDKIVYPMHGAGVIESIEEKEILGEIKKYYVIAMPLGDMKLMVPIDNADDIGVRNVIDYTDVNKVFTVLKQDTEITELNWNKRYRKNMDKMKSGDIFEVARIVRNLAFRDKEKGLSAGEKKMLNNAKQILISELILAEGSSSDFMNSKIEDIIEKN